MMRRGAFRHRRQLRRLFKSCILKNRVAVKGIWGYPPSMPSFQDLITQGAANAWLFIPSAILLGALHGLEPGHSKTMMAAFIVAVRGTVAQAVLLGLAATLSHTFVIWALAAAALKFGSQW